MKQNARESFALVRRRSRKCGTLDPLGKGLVEIQPIDPSVGLVLVFLPIVPSVGLDLWVPVPAG